MKIIEMTDEEIRLDLLKMQIKKHNTHVCTTADAKAFRKMCIGFGCGEYESVEDANKAILQTLDEVQEQLRTCISDEESCDVWLNHFGFLRAWK